jgi:probable F420-dependent oxidoreductase
MKFGVGISTCREGITYPVGFLDLHQNAQLAQEAEQLGFHSLWANDHFATQQSVADTLPESPNFYEPLVVFSFLAGRTSTIRMVLATALSPLRDTVLLAKQVATLDHASNGRFTLGLGIGAYREEFEAIRQPPPKTNRGKIMEEQVRALRALFTQRSVAFHGVYVRFSEIDIHPKPVQDPFPIYLSGNTPQGIGRTARLANGWIGGGSPPPERVAERVATLHDALKAEGRNSDSVEVSVQLRVAIGPTREQAREVVTGSQHFRRLHAKKSGQDIDALADAFARGDLMGTPDNLVARIAEYRDSGADHLGLVFLASDADELFERVRLFGTEVLPAFTS